MNFQFESDIWQDFLLILMGSDLLVYEQQDATGGLRFAEHDE